MTEIVINDCFGGFSLSSKAIERLRELGVRVDSLGNFYCKRHDPRLVQVVKELGSEASGPYSKLIVETIPGNKYLIDEYDGAESILTPETMGWIEA